MLVFDFAVKTFFKKRVSLITKSDMEERRKLKSLLVQVEGFLQNKLWIKGIFLFSL